MRMPRMRTFSVRGSCRNLGRGRLRTLALALSVFASACAPSEKSADALGQAVERIEDCATVEGVEWCSVNLGTSTSCAPSSGDTSEDDGTFTVSGNGEGLVLAGEPTDPYCGSSPEYNDQDGARFVFTEVSGDVELVVRLVSLSDVTNAQAGVMIRDAESEADSVAPMGAGLLVPSPLCSSMTPGVDFKVTARLLEPDDRLRVYGSQNGVDSRVTPPVWFRLRRIGGDFTVERSRDKRIWVPLDGFSGDAFASTNAQVGFFVAGDGSSAEAVFDDISVGAPASELRTTWIGSSFNAQSTDFVSNGMHAFYVAPDGTSYKYSQASETGHALNVIEAGGTLRKLRGGVFDNFGFYQGGLAGDGTHLYVAARASASPSAPGTVVFRKTMDLEPDGSLTFASSPAIGLVGGLAAGCGHIYVSDVTNDLVRVVDATTLEEGTDSFEFERPGPLAVDGDCNLWIIRTATEYPVIGCGTAACELSRFPGNFEQAADSAHEGLIACRKAADLEDECEDGMSQSLKIDAGVLGYGSQPFNPMGVTYDATGDRLFIADNGPNQNILICSDLDGPIDCNDFGAPGGLYSGSNPGLLRDVSYGGDRRFWSPLSAGADDSGNIYVASSAPQVDIRKFTDEGELVWGVYGIGPESGGFDPASDGEDFYTATRHFTFNTSNTDPGSEWAPKAVSLDPYGYPPRELSDSFGIGGAMVRRLKRDTEDDPGQLVLFQRAETRLLWSRYEGEIAIPAGALDVVQPRDNGENPDIPGCLRLWVDFDEDGREDRAGAEPDDCTTPCGESGTCEIGVVAFSELPYGGFWGFADSAGGIWLGFRSNPTNGEGAIWELPRTGMTTAGVPTYDLEARQLYPLPASTPELTTYANLVPYFDAAHDRLYLAGAAVDEELTACGLEFGALRPIIARYDDWRAHADAEEAPELVSVIVLPHPLQTHDQPNDFIGPDADEACGCPSLGEYGYKSWDVAGDFVFARDRFGQTFVFPILAGVPEAPEEGSPWPETRPVVQLHAGPEVSGRESWVDLAFSMQAFARSNGEYLITIADTISNARTLTLRWTPPEEPWTPAALSPSAWYVAAPGDVTVDESGNVSQWSDRSGNGLHVGNSFSPGQPSYDADGWNSSKPTIQFNGAKLLRSTSWSGAPAGADAAFSVLAVIRSAASQNASIAAWWSNVGVDSVRCEVADSSGTTLLKLSRDDNAWATQSKTGTEDLGTDRHVVAWRYSPEVLKVTIDDETFTSSTQSSLGTISPTVFLVGARSDLPTQLFSGDISELVVIPSEISDADVANFREYAQAAWGGLP
jgi:hypothetical protein